jgi:nucleotide-binding universal stress UspA family protein
MFEKILVCVDGSERSIEAARVAARLAKIHQARLSALHVCPLPTVKVAFPGAPDFAAPMLHQYVTEVQRVVGERVQPAFQEIGTPYEILEETGDPVEVIARIADTRGYDLIVLGSRNLDKDKAAQLGSVSHGVLSRAHCLTLVVR